jgi:hypothetical protein
MGTGAVKGAELESSDPFSHWDYPPSPYSRLAFCGPVSGQLTQPITNPERDDTRQTSSSTPQRHIVHRLLGLLTKPKSFLGHLLINHYPLRSCGGQ